MDGICPFTLPILRPQGPPVSLASGGKTQSVHVGLPCVRQRCKWWSMIANDCVIHEIANYLAQTKEET